MIKQGLSFLRIPLREKIFLFKALVVLVKYRVLLKKLSFQEILNLALQQQSSYLNKVTSVLPVPRTVRLTYLASKFTPFSTCLSNALGALPLFASQSYDTVLHIGVKGRGERFEAHAWLTYDGVVVLGWLPNLHSFTELPPAQFNGV